MIKEPRGCRNIYGSFFDWLVDNKSPSKTVLNCLFCTRSNCKFRNYLKQGVKVVKRDDQQG